MHILYNDIQVRTQRADFIIEDKIMTKLKAVIELEDVQLAQALNYSKAYNLEAGLLMESVNLTLSEFGN